MGVPPADVRPVRVAGHRDTLPEYRREWMVCSNRERDSGDDIGYGNGHDPSGANALRVPITLVGQEAEGVGVRLVGKMVLPLDQDPVGLVEVG